MSATSSRTPLYTSWGAHTTRSRDAVVVSLPAKRRARLSSRTRLYYHLTQLEEARLIEIAEYRRLPGGKVERVYRPTPVEPPGDEATPLEFAEFLGVMLEATRADITAASTAKEAGARREITLQRATVRLSEAQFVTLREHLLSLVRLAQEQPNDEGVWTRVVVTLVDLQDRGQPTSKGGPA